MSGPAKSYDAWHLCEHCDEEFHIVDAIDLDKWERGTRQLMSVICPSCDRTNVFSVPGKPKEDKGAKAQDDATLQWLANMIVRGNG